MRVISGYVKCYYKHDRAIDDKDKYFIVDVVVDGGLNAEIGYIEKEFNEYDFITKFPGPGFIEKVLSVREFSDYNEYKRQRDNH